MKKRGRKLKEKCIFFLCVFLPKIAKGTREMTQTQTTQFILDGLIRNSLNLFSCQWYITQWLGWRVPYSDFKCLIGKGSVETMSHYFLETWRRANDQLDTNSSHVPFEFSRRRQCRIHVKIHPDHRITNHKEIIGGGTFKGTQNISIVFKNNISEWRLVNKSCTFFRFQQWERT